jgi:hypothetical protein
MAQQGDYPRGREPGYTQAAGFRPNAQSPRMRPPATPTQWQESLPSQDPRPTPQFSPRQDPRQPAFTPDPWRDSEQPGGQYPPPQPAWQQPYPPQPSYAPQPPQPRPKSRKGLAFFGCGGLFALVILIAALASHSSPSSSAPPAPSMQQTPAAAPPAQGSAPAAAAQTVTYVVTGSTADVTYGPAGSSLSGSVPMHVTKDIPSSAPVYYSIDAQLQGSGSVSCQVLVSGKVISSSTATGGYNIASCEIGQDPFSGNWEDDNG